MSMVRTDTGMNAAESSSWNRWQLKRDESWCPNLSDALQTNGSRDSSATLTMCMKSAAPKEMNSTNSCSPQEQPLPPQNICELVSWREVGLACSRILDLVIMAEFSRKRSPKEYRKPTAQQSPNATMAP